MNIATTKTHTPTHTYRQRPCQTPGYPTSPCRCSSQCRAHTSSGTPGRLEEQRVKVSTSGLLNRFETEETGSQQTCTEVRLAASTQDGIELGLVRSHFVFASSVKFLSAKQTCRISNEDVSRLPSNCLWLCWHHKQRTWASCWTREMSTFFLSSRFPWTQSDTQNSHLVCSRLVLKLSAKWQPTKFVPERERWEVCGSDQRCRCWWRLPSSSRTLKGRHGFSMQCKF